MRPSTIGSFVSVSDYSEFPFSEENSHISKVRSVSQPAINSSSSLSLSPIVTRAVSWEEEDSRLSPEQMSLDDKTSQLIFSEDSVGTCESLASDASEQSSVNRKRKKGKEDDRFTLEVSFEENLDLEEAFWDSGLFRDAQMTIGEALQRTFGPLCQKDKERIEIYKKFLDFLCENLQEKEFFEQRNFLQGLHQKNLFRIEDVNRPVYLKESFDKIEKLLIKLIRTFTQEKIGDFLSQSHDKSEIQSVKHILELSFLYREIDTLLVSSYDFRIKDRLYEFPKQLARLGYGDEAIALIGEFASHFPDRVSESRVLSSVAKILARDGKMEKAMKALNAIELDSVKQEFLSHLKYVE